jgi:hypothetical protein
MFPSFFVSFVSSCVHPNFINFPIHAMAFSQARQPGEIDFYSLCKQDKCQMQHPQKH